MVILKPSTSISTTGATINGKLLSYDGTDQPTVTLLYGMEDNGTNDSAWDNTSNLGAKNAGDFNQSITGLAPGTRYFFRLKATNNAGSSYSSNAGEFVTIGTPAIEGKPRHQPNRDHWHP